jgi:stage V sporulation protein AE
VEFDLPKRKVVVITDGDRAAQRVVEQVARNVGGRAISLSGGNPTQASGADIVAAVQRTPYDPVLVMIDDCGCQGEGRGEKILEALARADEIEILGVVAVASNTAEVEGAPVTAAVTRTGQVVARAVDKDGHPQAGGDLKIHGDTVDVLNRLQIPVVIGIGDLGKMDAADLVANGAHITTQAVREVLNRSNFPGAR